MMDTDDGPFEADDLLWLICEFEHNSAPSLADLLEDCDAREIEVSRRRLATVVAEAQAAGLVEIWAEGPGYVTLTPLAAERMGVELRIDSRSWIPRGKLYTEQVGLKSWEEYCPVDPQNYIDPTLPEPLDVLVDLESRGTLLGPGEFRLRDGSTLKINQVLGIGRPWPWALLAGPGEPCRGCDGRRLSRNACCAVCHAAGVDGALPPVEPALKRPVPPPKEDLFIHWPKPPAAAGPKLSGGLGGRAKGRKKAKMTAA
jgi:hypothetical protein